MINGMKIGDKVWWCGGLTPHELVVMKIVETRSGFYYHTEFEHTIASPITGYKRDFYRSKRRAVNAAVRTLLKTLEE